MILFRDYDFFFFDSSARSTNATQPSTKTYTDTLYLSFHLLHSFSLFADKAQHSRKHRYIKNWWKYSRLQFQIWRKLCPSASLYFSAQIIELGWQSTFPTTNHDPFVYRYILFLFIILSFLSFFLRKKKIITNKIGARPIHTFSSGKAEKKKDLNLISSLGNEDIN